MTFSKSDEFCFSVVFVGGVLRQVGEGVSETKSQVIKLVISKEHKKYSEMFTKYM